MKKSENFCDESLIVNFCDLCEQEKYSLRIKPFSLINGVTNRISNINQFLWFYPKNEKKNIDLGKKLYLNELLYEKNKIVIGSDLSSRPYNITKDINNVFFPINFYCLDYMIVNKNNKKLIINLFDNNENKKTVDLIFYIRNFDCFIYFDIDLNVFKGKDNIYVDINIPIETKKEYKITLDNKNIIFIEKIVDEYFSFNNYEFNEIKREISIKNTKEKILKILNDFENANVQHLLMPMNTFILSKDNLYLKSIKISNNFFKECNIQRNEKFLTKNFDEFSNFIEYNLFFDEKYFRNETFSSLIYYLNFLSNIKKINEDINFMLLNKSILRISDFSLDLKMLNEMNNQNSDFKDIAYLFFEYFVRIFIYKNIFNYLPFVKEIRKYLIDFFVENFDNNKIKSYLLKNIP